MPISARHALRIRRLEVAYVRAIADVLNMSRGESRFFDGLDFWITRVQVDRDLRRALVYFYTELDALSQSKLIRFFQNRSLLFSKQLRSRVKVRELPYLEFRFDEQEKSQESLLKIFQSNASSS